MLSISNTFLKREGLGFLIKKQGITKKPRSRTLQTYLNKVQKLKNTYSKLKKKSEKLYKKYNKNHSIPFHQKFSTFESYAKGYKLKEAGK